MNKSARLPDQDLIRAAFQYALSLCSHHQDAEDYVQQACLQLCRRYGRVKSRQLLFTAIRNLYFDRCRRNKIISFQSYDGSEEHLTNEEVELQFPSDVDVTEVLECLSPSDRELIYLQLVEGYSASEISRITHQPRGTVLWKLSKAKAELRAFVKSEYPMTDGPFGKESQQ